jgi:hypothetical protein
MNVPDTILTKIKVTLVSKLYSIAVIEPLSTAEVERIFSQVALIKSSHRANIKTETHSKILNIKYKKLSTLMYEISTFP